jgi:hypothetical protein
MREFSVSSSSGDVDADPQVAVQQLAQADGVCGGLLQRPSVQRR